MPDVENRDSTREHASRPPVVASDEINLLDYLRVICKYRKMILGLTLVAMIAAVGSSIRKPRMYQVSTSIVPPMDMLQQGGLAGKLGGAGSSLLHCRAC